MRTYDIVFLSLFAWLACAPVYAVTITENGKPAATIVLAGEPTQAAAFAAGELQLHIERMTGTRLPQVTDAGAGVSGPRILVGESSATRELGLRSADFKPYERLVKFLPDTLILIGRDTGRDPATGVPNGAPCWDTGRFGKALRFDGQQTGLTIEDCGFSDTRGTLEAWVRMPKEQQDHHGTILRLDGRDPWSYHIVQRPPNSDCIGYWVYNSKAVRVVVSKPLTEGWHHVMATYAVDPNRIELFIDGASHGTAEYLQTTCKGVPLTIGAVKPFPTLGNVFAGLIDEVRVSGIVRQPTLDAPHTADADTLLLLHCDEGVGTPEDSSGRPGNVRPPGWYDERGTLDAVYDFLERYCGVRWYAPTEIGLCCPQTATLSVDAPDLRRTPAMVYKWIAETRLYLPTPDDPVPGRDVTLWKLRMRLGGKPFSVNHSFYGYYDRFLEREPDWFAKGHSGRPPQMCFTNPEFIAQVAQDARDYYDGLGLQPGARAMGDYFALVPMDNDTWCLCDACQADIDADEKDNRQFTNGKASTYVWRFVNKVAQEVARTHPHKTLSAIAYASYAHYPKAVKLEPNIATMMCLTARHWWAPGMEAADRQVFDAWTAEANGRQLRLWLYYCFPALNAKHGRYNAFPGFFAHTVIEQMKLWTDAGIQGLFLEHSSEFGQSYLMDQLEFYLTFRLADDPSLDAQALYEEFFRRYYGAAAEPMRSLYERIEATYMNTANYPKEAGQLPGSTQHQNEDIAWKHLGTQARMREFAALMAAAKEAAKTETEKLRVGLFERGIWDYMKQGKAQYQKRAKWRAHPLPQAKVPRCAEPLKGNLAQVDWSRAAVLDGWRRLNGEPTQRRLQARLTHDGEFLYIELVEETDPSKLVSAGDIWSGDDWELFFAAERARPYRQLGVAPNGSSKAVAPNEPGGTWDCGTRMVSDTSAPDRWTVRIALPLSELLPGHVAPGAKLYANLCRATAGFDELLAWSPTFEARFNAVERLGCLQLE